MNFFRNCEWLLGRQPTVSASCNSWHMLGLPAMHWKFCLISNSQRESIVLTEHANLSWLVVSTWNKIVRILAISGLIRNDSHDWLTMSARDVCVCQSGALIRKFFFLKKIFFNALSFVFLNCFTPQGPLVILVFRNHVYIFHRQMCCRNLIGHLWIGSLSLTCQPPS